MSMARNPGELRYQPLSEAAALGVWEPRGGYALREAWESRTYEFLRAQDGWTIDTNPGYLHRESWEHVVAWFCRMCPVDIELLTTV